MKPSERMTFRQRGMAQLLEKLNGTVYCMGRRSSCQRKRVTDKVPCFLVVTARDRGLVFRPSAGAKLRDLLIRTEQSSVCHRVRFCGFVVNLFHLLFDPAHAG